MTTPERQTIIDAPACRLMPEVSCFRKPGARECLRCLVAKVRMAYGLPTASSDERIDEIITSTRERKAGE